jgi:alpha-glucosidase
MSNEQAHTVKVPLGFLGDGKFSAKIWQEGGAPTELKVTDQAVSASDSLKLRLAPSGGAAILIDR